MAERLAKGSVFTRPRQGEYSNRGIGRRSGNTYIPCRSELAREKPERAAVTQSARVCVDVFREQARSYNKKIDRPYFFVSASNQE